MASSSPTRRRQFTNEERQAAKDGLRRCIAELDGIYCRLERLSDIDNFEAAVQDKKRFVESARAKIKQVRDDIHQILARS